ncbi:MAG: hypothetical protein ABL883_03955 [Terricaulis sp.]
MLVYIWLCVMTQAFMPGGDRIASAFEAHLRAEPESPTLIGAAGHVARYTPLAARGL